MEKIISSLIATLICVTNLVSASAYSSIENSIIYVVDYQTSDNSTHIVLSNGLAVCYKDTDLFVDHGWKFGDRVLLDHARNRFYLENASFRGRIPVTIVETAVKLNTIHNIKKNEARKTLRLTLNDGTEWHVGAWSAAWTDEWEVGDQIAAVAYPFLTGKATHWILNMNRRTAKQPIAIRARLRTQASLPYIQDENARPIRQDKTSIITKVVDLGAMLQQMGNSKKSRNIESLQADQQLRQFQQSFPFYMIQLDNDQYLMGATHGKPKSSWEVGEKVVLDFTYIQPRLVNLRTLDAMEVYNTQAATLFTQDLKIARITSNGKAELSNGAVVRMRRLANTTFAVGDSVRYIPSPNNPNIGLLSHADNPKLPGATVSIVR